MSSTVAAILQRAAEGGRLSLDDGATLFHQAGLLELGRAAQAVCQRLHPEPFRTYNIDRNINYTNVCTAVCDFCAFYRKVDDTEAYVLDRDVLLEKIRETVELGGDQILLQGGLHPHLKLEWYEELLRDIKEHFPGVNVHGFSARRFTTSPRSPSCRSKRSCGGSRMPAWAACPAAAPRSWLIGWRRDITRGKVLTDNWLQVHRVWHELGGRSTATMMFGHVETLKSGSIHFERIRQLQDETGGFTAFISWTFQPDHTDMADVPPAGAFEYLKTQAISRLYLDNVPNIQSSWVTQGAKSASSALYFGANDMGSLMIEENVVSSAGTVHT